MSAEVWDQVYRRMADLIREHRTTLVFVNTRRLAERVTRHLSDLLGGENVAAHHGSLAKDQRFDAEQRLKHSKLKALVATASLELGIDIGDVDLVCQLGSPRSIASFLQRVGRSGHAVDGTPKGRLFPLSRDELVECAALLDSVRRGDLDRLDIASSRSTCWRSRLSPRLPHVNAVRTSFTRWCVGHGRIETSHGRILQSL
jgi:ATP-dependent Lhr-like helicase